MSFFRKICPRRTLSSENRKVHITITFCIFELVLVPYIILNKWFWILQTSSSEKDVWTPKQKCEHHHRILHIQVNWSITLAFIWNSALWEKFNFCFSELFSQYWQNFYFWRRTKHWSINLSSFLIFLIFSDFLRS